MSKGELTREKILDHAAQEARRVGLTGLSIGDLARDLGLSKSGLFAHFGSKEALQVAVLDHAAQGSVEVMVRPALAAPRGEPRLRALLDRWLAWARPGDRAGGCLFVQVSSEIDDVPGPARDRLVAIQRDWLDVLAHAIRVAVREGHFRADVDPEQLAFELYGTMLMCHLSSRLLDDPQAIDRTRAAFEGLVARARA